MERFLLTVAAHCQMEQLSSYGSTLPSPTSRDLVLFVIYSLFDQIITAELNSERLRKKVTTVA